MAKYVYILKNKQLELDKKKQTKKMINQNRKGRKRVQLNSTLLSEEKSQKVKILNKI